MRHDLDSYPTEPRLPRIEPVNSPEKQAWLDEAALQIVTGAIGYSGPDSELAEWAYDKAEALWRHRARRYRMNE
jgi:hypothetical protein